MTSLRCVLPALALLSAAIVASCAPKPSLRSAIYEEFGADYAAMKPAVGIPGKDALSNNDFRYVPGHLTIPRLGSARDDIKREVAIWRINQAAEDCAPSPTLYNLPNVTALPHLPVYIEYVRDSRNWLVPQVTHDAKAMKIDLKLRNNDIRYVNRIRIALSNVKIYSASKQQMDDALKDIMSSSRCRFAFRGRRDAMQINSIVRGDISIQVDLLEGASATLSDDIKARVFNSIAKHIDGEGLFFAVRGTPAFAPIRTRDVVAKNEYGAAN